MDYPIVYIIDDDEPVRDSLSFLLGDSNYLVKTYDSGEAFLAELDVSYPIACVVTDVRMPGMTGPELQERLIALGCYFPIIFITGHGSVSMAVDSMKKGAVDFIEKPFSHEELREKIDYCIGEMSARRIVERETQNIIDRISSLTAREQDVLKCLLGSMTNKETAKELGISIKTVEVHRSRLMEKLQARSVAEVVQIVMLYNSLFEEQGSDKRLLFM